MLRMGPFPAVPTCDEVIHRPRCFPFSRLCFYPGTDPVWTSLLHIIFFHSVTGSSSHSFSCFPLPLHSRSLVTQAGCEPCLCGTSTGLDLTSVLIQQLNARTKARLLTGCEHAAQHRLAVSTPSAELVRLARTAAEGSGQWTARMHTHKGKYILAAGRAIKVPVT